MHAGGCNSYHLLLLALLLLLLLQHLQQVGLSIVPLKHLPSLSVTPAKSDTLQVRG
jgi:hypothetical protein